MVPQEQIKQKTVVEQVMEKIKELIASGEYKSGDKLPTEHELGEMFGIGRSSIREAIKIFNYLGVLESKTAKGTFVCDSHNVSAEALTWSIMLGDNDLFDLIEIRAAIELWSILEITRAFNADPDSVERILKKLQDLVNKMTTAVTNGNNEDLTECDYLFHHEIIENGGNPLFSSLYNTLRSFMYEEITKSYQPNVDLTTVPGNHQMLIDAIRTGNQTKVTEAVQWHIYDTEEKMKKTIKKH